MVLVRQREGGNEHHVALPHRLDDRPQNLLFDQHSPVILVEVGESDGLCPDDPAGFVVFQRTRARGFSCRLEATLAVPRARLHGRSLISGENGEDADRVSRACCRRDRRAEREDSVVRMRRDDHDLPAECPGLTELAVAGQGSPPYSWYVCAPRPVMRPAPKAARCKPRTSICRPNRGAAATSTAAWPSRTSPCANRLSRRGPESSSSLRHRLSVFPRRYSR